VRSHETHSGLDRHARPARPAISGLSNELLSNQVEGRLIATSGNFFTVADRSATVGPSALHLRHPAGMDDSARAHTGWDDIPYRRESHLETSTEAFVNATALIEIYVMRQAAGGHRSVL
jgi:hypothetical protein